MSSGQVLPGNPASDDTRAKGDRLVNIGRQILSDSNVDMNVKCFFVQIRNKQAYLSDTVVCDVLNFEVEGSAS